ncbi:hypothetical protein HN014_04395 [Aquimarina sp. TRL1]|uniref:hypothetical protein n=1 Tax=Aquimarina sp. (strain TRL1) TaxID=2736252 RepID=UPI00158E6966|nr:hypothetical protein [Aquimarina sp. TRL1]QKX04178.1 hypothetical protein HN014_04395 [Aquimarina sp. TRL1]
MIFLNNQLMPSEDSATLFMVSNPIPFENFEDHQAGVYIRLHNLIAWSMEEGDDPIALIEEYLETVYTDSKSVEEIANFLMYHDKMQSALWGLKENWSNLDDTVPEDSLMYGGVEKGEAVQMYADTTLRRYLEVLSRFENV